MGVFDNLANRFHLGDSEDDYDDEDEMDDYGDDDDYEDEEPRRGGGIFGGGGRRNRQREDEDMDEDDPDVRGNGGRASIKGSQNSRGAQLAPIRSRGGAVSGGKMQVRIIKPSSFDQARQITDTLLSQRTVLLNLEGLDVNTAQRIVDFASGSCYALHGNFMKISHFIIVITPENVDIAGDISVGGPGVSRQQAGAAAVITGAAMQQNNGSMGAMNGGMNGNMNGGMNNNGMNGNGMTGSGNPYNMMNGGY